MNYDVYGLGNALVDTEYEVDDAFLGKTPYPKGIMTLIEEEDRASLIRLLEDEHEHQVVKQAGGGSAANTTVIVAQLGGRAFYSCKVASDPTGDFFIRDLDLAGVDTNLGPDREPGVTGECISMVTPDAERTMTTHLGITQNLSAAELRPEVLKNSRYLYIEGYLVSSENGFAAALEAQRIAREAGVAVTLTLSDPAMVENFRDQFGQLMDGGVDILFCNEEEARLWSGEADRDAAAAVIAGQVGAYVITCGAGGALVADRGDAPALVPGVATQPVDTTGAGDIFAGAFLYAIAGGAAFAQAAVLANQAASILVASFGARLPIETVEAELHPLRQ